MIRCEICKKSVFDADKLVVDYETIKKATKYGFIPSYYIERDKEGTEYGLPKERKWVNIVKTWPRENIELCKECHNEMNEALDKKKLKLLYCFIATAAYDSPHAPEVTILRKFRDKVLLQSLSGRLFVNIYYFLSPPIAAIITKSETLKSISKKYFLEPIIRWIIKNGEVRTENR